MRIAAHHIKGTPDHTLSSALGQAVDYTPVCAWPDDCMVQWGHGIIPANPFFEAFPPGTFIRGDGETIEDAERKAFAKYERQIGCDHIWGRHHPTRGTYTNGLGWCRRCGRSEGRRFPPIVTLGHMRKPLSAWEVDWVDEPLEPDIAERLEAQRPGYLQDRARSMKLLGLRRHLFGLAADGREEKA